MTDQQQTNQDLNQPVQPPQPSQEQFQQPQPIYQQPVQNQYQQPQPMYQQPVESKEDKAGTIALVCGICSFTGILIALSGWILGIIAIVYGSRGLKGANATKSRAGLICGIIGLVVSAINSFAGVIMFN